MSGFVRGVSGRMTGKAVSWLPRSMKLVELPRNSETSAGSRRKS
jgi:hypothetical protein